MLQLSVEEAVARARADLRIGAPVALVSAAGAVLDQLRGKGSPFEEASAAQGEYLLSRLSMRAGRGDEAKARLEQVIVSSPKMAAAWEQLAGLSLKSAAWGDALDVVRRGIESCGETAALLRKLGAKT